MSLDRGEAVGIVSKGIDVGMTDMTDMPGVVEVRRKAADTVRDPCWPPG